VLINLWLSKGISFLQDNAAPHKAAITHQKLADLHFAVLKHPAYSPDLAPSDYYLFLNLFIKPKTYQPPSCTHNAHERKIIHQHSEFSRKIWTSITIVYKVQQLHQNNSSALDDGRVGRNMSCKIGQINCKN
jgi:hypothetical protein